MDKEIKQGPEEILEEKLVKIQQRQEWKRFFIECLVLMSAVYVIFHFIIGIAFVSGHSMEPTLKDGEMVLLISFCCAGLRTRVQIPRKTQTESPEWMHLYLHAQHCPGSRSRGCWLPV